MCESCDNGEEDPPVPISNTEVKLFSAEDTWRAAARENRSLQVIYTIDNEFNVLYRDIRPHGQAVKTSPFHGGNPSSILGGVTIEVATFVAGLLSLVTAYRLSDVGSNFFMFSSMLLSKIY